MKESNRMLRENIQILKEKMIEENKQKRIVVGNKMDLIKHSIENYKKNKKNYIENTFAKDAALEEELIQKKEKELEFWKMSQNIKDPDFIKFLLDQKKKYGDILKLNKILREKRKTSYSMTNIF